MAFLLLECEEAVAQGQSQRAFCREAGIARSTLRDAAEREVVVDAPDATVAFFTSPEGQVLLRRFVFAAHFVITLLGCGGIQLVCTLLRLSGLAPFVGSSYGAQHRINTSLLEHLGAFGQAEQQRLGATMPKKKIWLCEDETFFPRMVLVALDALSGFILVERFAERRDEATWTSKVCGALRGLPVEVLGVTSDQAKGIVAHARKALCVSVTPDLFHFQHEFSGVCCAPLASGVRALERALTEAQERGHDKQGRDDVQVNQALAVAREWQERMGAVLEATSEATHPYELYTGESRSGPQVDAELNEMLDEAEFLADEAQLPEASYTAIAKSRRAIKAMAASVTGFHSRVNLALAQLSMPPALERAMKERVLPALYMEAAADRSRESETRKRLHESAKTLVAPLHDKESGPLAELSEACVRYLLEQGKEWVSWYVRASSCVEGRNGQLSLHHHSLHILSDAKLAALTVMHNFWIQRADGTVAAERFFEQRPRDVFDWLLDVMADLPYPAQKRPRVAHSPLLN